MGTGRSWSVLQKQWEVDRDSGMAPDSLLPKLTAITAACWEISVINTTKPFVLTTNSLSLKGLLWRLSLTYFPAPSPFPKPWISHWLGLMFHQPEPSLTFPCLLFCLDPALPRSATRSALCAMWRLSSSCTAWYSWSLEVGRCLPACHCCF